MTSGSAVAIVRYVIMLTVTGAVAWGLWCSQGPGQAAYRDAPVHEDGPVSLYPPSFTYVDATKHGWPAIWLVRRATRDSLSRTVSDISYTAIPCGLAGDVLAWASILACTAHTMWLTLRRPAQFSLRTLLSAHVAAAVLLGWWGVEYANTQSINDPVLTQIIKDAPATPLLRLLRCGPSVSVPVLFGLFCVFVTVNRGFLKLFEKRKSETRARREGQTLGEFRYHERAGVSKKSTLGSVPKPQVYSWQETPECYTSVSTSTSGS